MKQLRCPLNGLRNINEFVHGGELQAQPDPAGGSDQEWSDYVFTRANTRGVVAEWWCHSPSSLWFIAERNTATDQVIGTWLYEEWLRLRAGVDGNA